MRKLQPSSMSVRRAADDEMNGRGPHRAPATAMMATATPARPTAPDPYLLGGGFMATARRCSCVPSADMRLAGRWLPPGSEISNLSIALVALVATVVSSVLTFEQQSRKLGPDTLCGSCVTFGRSRALRWRAVIRHTTGSEGDAMDALRGSRLGGCAPRWTEALLQPGLLAPAPCRMCSACAHEGTARMHTL